MAAQLRPGHDQQEPEVAGEFHEERRTTPRRRNRLSTNALVPAGRLCPEGATRVPGRATRVPEGATRDPESATRVGGVSLAGLWRIAACRPGPGGRARR